MTDSNDSTYRCLHCGRKIKNGKEHFLVEDDDRYREPVDEAEKADADENGNYGIFGPECVKKMKAGVPCNHHPKGGFTEDD